MNAMLPAPATNVSAGTSIRSLLVAALHAIMQQPRAKEAELASATIATAPSNINRAFSFLTGNSEARELRLQQAYLAEATDLYDLEYRSREWDRKARSNPSW